MIRTKQQQLQQQNKQNKTKDKKWANKLLAHLNQSIKIHKDLPTKLGSKHILFSFEAS